MSVFLGIEHAGVVAKDTVTLSKWYGQTFGMVEVYNNKKTPPTIFMKAPNGMMIEFVPIAGKPKTLPEEKDEGWRHVAILVKKIETAMAELDKKGVQWVAEMKSSPETGVKARFFRDPEGNILHIIERPKPL